MVCKCLQEHWLERWPLWRWNQKTLLRCWKQTFKAKKEALHWKHYHFGSGSGRHHRGGKSKNSTKRTNPSWSATSFLWREAIGRSRCMSDYNVGRTSTLPLILRLHRGLQMFARTLTGEMTTLEVGPADTMRWWKQNFKTETEVVGRWPLYEWLQCWERSNSPLDFLRRHSGKQIFIRTFTGRMITLEVK